MASAAPTAVASDPQIDEAVVNAASPVIQTTDEAAKELQPSVSRAGLPRFDLERTLGIAAKSITAVVVLVYALGFIIVSLHHASFGFAIVNPFRPRIVCAGLWFLLLTAFPIITLRQCLTPKADSTLKCPDWQRNASIILGYCGACTVLSWCSGSVFAVAKTTWPLISLILLLLSAVFVFSAAYFKRRNHPRLNTAMSISAFLVMVGSSVYRLCHTRQFTIDAVFLWFLAIGFVAFYFKQVVTDRTGLNWMYGVSLIITMLSMFSKVYYSRIEASWGGGRPVPVVLSLSHEIRLTAGQQFRADLLDESDAGYYVTTENDKKALYIPRSAVSAVYFSDSSPKLPPTAQKIRPAN